MTSPLFSVLLLLTLLPSKHIAMAVNSVALLLCKCGGEWLGGL